ncbi:MAG: hypothetical protein C4308_00230 [Chitinophagaceae bacterium]
MKKISILIVLAAMCFSFSRWVKNDEPVPIPPSKQRVGNADSGYHYIISGDYIKSGVPLSLYFLVKGKEKTDVLNRGGANGKLPYDLNVVKAYNGEEIVVPNCLQCHAQVFHGELIIGLGNTLADFTEDRGGSKSEIALAKAYLKLSPKKNEAAKDFIAVGEALRGNLVTAVPGANPADRLAALLVSHRDAETLAWKDKVEMNIPDEVIASDVPAWWLLKKKNAMFYNGFGRGDFGKFLMGSALLTIRDTVHAKDIDSHMPDVLAYLYSLAAPKYPLPVNESLASEGKIIFEKNCSGCHGTYGPNGNYPNLLIPQSIIGTDSLLNKSNYQYTDMINWYNQSWFAKGDHPARLEPFNGYIAPPLDGVWITAPYFHNGAVPTVEAVLNSELRPTYWTRNFSKTEYDYEKLGLKFTAVKTAGDKTIYNTTLPGYGNYGHTFGDHLTEKERKAVIEYLKTL